jgi:methionine-rich copper-binding protein CopC
MKRPVVLALVAALVAAAVPVLAATPAHAHAEVIAQGPRDGAVLTATSSRTTVYVDFGEVVSITGASLRIRDAAGVVRSLPATIRALPSSDPDITPSRVSAVSRTALPKGRYAVEYSVLSQDGHRVVRAFGFGVGVYTSVAKPGLVPLRTVVTTLPAPRTVISRAAVGLRTISVRMPSGTAGGTVQLVCQRVGTASARVSAPFNWTLGPTVSGYASARGYIPTPCRYTITVTVNRPFPKYPSAWTTSVGLLVGAV